MRKGYFDCCCWLLTERHKHNATIIKSPTDGLKSYCFINMVLPTRWQCVMRGLVGMWCKNWSRVGFVREGSVSRSVFRGVIWSLEGFNEELRLGGNVWPWWGRKLRLVDLWGGILEQYGQNAFFPCPEASDGNRFFFSFFFSRRIWTKFARFSSFVTFALQFVPEGSDCIGDCCHIRVSHFPQAWRHHILTGRQNRYLDIRPRWPLSGHSTPMSR